MPNILISDKPYAQWLNKGLAEFDKHNLRSLAIIGIDSDTREMLTGYYQCSVNDKAVMAANIQADALYDTVIANAAKIVAAAEDQNESDDFSD